MKVCQKKHSNHLRSQGSFQFALSVALVAVLVAFLVALIGQVGTIMTYSSQAAYQQNR